MKTYYAMVAKTRHYEKQIVANSEQEARDKITNQSPVELESNCIDSNLEILSIEAREENQEETCPKCKGELVEAGLHNCWPYECWVCIKCNQEYTVELVRDWTTISEED